MRASLSLCVCVCACVFLNEFVERYSYSYAIFVVVVVAAFLLCPDDAFYASCFFLLLLEDSIFFRVIPVCFLFLGRYSKFCEGDMFLG